MCEENSSSVNEKIIGAQIQATTTMIESESMTHNGGGLLDSDTENGGATANAAQQKLKNRESYMIIRDTLPRNEKNPLQKSNQFRSLYSFQTYKWLILQT